MTPVNRDSVDQPEPKGLGRGPMDVDRWREVRRLVEEAGALPAGDRGKFLEEHCLGDSVLRKEAESLLAVPEQALELLDRLHFRIEAVTPWAGTLEQDQRVGPYRVVEELDRGGMGAVYLAADEEHGRQVAIKLVRTRRGDVSGREKKILARLNHVGIAQLYDSGVTEEEFPYFVMEHVHGLPLDRYADEHHLTLRERIRLFIKVCSAVEYAHSHQVVHRDLKPANVLVGEDGEPKLLDFGISKLVDPDEELPPTGTATGTGAMTPAFASPEQVRGEWTATTSDIYSLGVMLHLLLTGRLPYSVQSQHEVFWAIAEVEVERPSRIVERDEQRLGPSGVVESVDAGDTASARATNPRALARALDGDLDAILMKALRKEPERRYRTVYELSEDLRNYLVDEPVGARRGSTTYSARKFIRRHRKAVAAVVVLALLNLGTSVALLLAERESAEARRRAESEAARAAQELRKAEEVQAFLVETFNAANPSRRETATETVEALLERGRSRLEETRLDPELRADIAATVGMAYEGQGLYDEAGEFLEKILVETIEATGPDSMATANVMDVLGMVERNRGNLDRSSELLGKTLEILTREEQARAADIGDGYTELATTLFKAGKLEEAVEAARAGIRVLDDSSNGETESLLAEAQSELGLMLHDLGRFEEAQALHRQAVTTIERLVGPRHPDYGRALNNLGMTLQARGEFEEAQELLIEASTVYEERLGGEHPDLLVNLNNLGATAYYAGAYQAAALAQEEVVRRMLAVQAAEHPNSIASLANLGVFRKAAGDLDGAREALEEAYATAGEALGRDHWLTANAAFQLARVLKEKDELIRAETLFELAVSTFEESLGPENWRTASAKLEWALLLQIQGQPARAEALSLEGLKALRRSEGTEHWRTAHGESVRAEILMRTRRFDEAEELLLHAVERLKHERGDGVLETEIAVERLRDLHESRHRPKVVTIPS